MKYGLEIGKEYISNNYGIYYITEFIYNPNKSYNKTTVIVKFKLSGYSYETTLYCARNGIVRDPTLPHTIPIDMMCLDKNEREKRLHIIAKIIWKGMRDRCSNKKSINHDRYGAKGVTICNEWLNDFDAFENDLPYLFQYDKWSRFPTLYNLDKDYKAYLNNESNRHYSKDTCVFLHYMDNMNLRSIEYKNKHGLKYFGVDCRIINNREIYRPRLFVNNKETYFGNYEYDYIAAAVYNYHYINEHKKFPRFELIPLLNDVEYMEPTEFVKYNITSKLMAEII